MDDRKGYFISLGIILLSMYQFLSLDKINSKEIVMIASLVAIGVIGRIAFYWLPQFKPVTAIIIISSIMLGSKRGFLIAVLTAFLSNFFFGQGVWTPYQMSAWGFIAVLTGELFKRVSKDRLVISIYGFIATFCIYGVIMNFSSVLMFTTEITWDIVKPYLIAGIPFDLIHGISTAVFLFFIYEPMKDKIERIKLKYGIGEL